MLVVGYAVVSSWLAPVLLAPLFNDFEQLPPGRTRARRSCGSGARPGSTSATSTRSTPAAARPAINAYVNGLGSTKRVVLYDNTLRELSPAELRSVVAHELGHVEARRHPRAASPSSPWSPRSGCSSCSC